MDARTLAETMSFPHPETGELLDSQEDFQAALAAIEERMAPLYRIRRVIREEAAKRFEVRLPRARYRTEKQDRVARCPRCGGKLENERN